MHIFAQGSVGQKSGTAWLSSLLKVWHRPQSGIGQAEFSSRGAGEKSAFKPFLVGRIQLLVVVGLRRLLSVWLSQESCAQLLNLTPVSCSVAPPLLSCKWYVESFPFFQFLTFSSATSWRKLFTFKGPLWLGQPHPIISILRPTD